MAKNKIDIYPIPEGKLNKLWKNHNEKMKEIKQTPTKYENDKMFLQCQCVEWFRSKYPDYLIFSTNNEATRRHTAFWDKSGYVDGLADLVIVTDRGVLFVLVRANKHPRKEKEVKFRQKVEMLGYKYRCIKSLQTFQDVVITFLLGGDVSRCVEYNDLTQRVRTNRSMGLTQHEDGRKVRWKNKGIKYLERYENNDTDTTTKYIEKYEDDNRGN